jgi:hypothetical protein
MGNPDEHRQASDRNGNGKSHTLILVVMNKDPVGNLFVTSTCNIFIEPASSPVPLWG